MHPELAPVAIIAALSLSLPLPWHWRARNVATLSIIFWLFILNIVYATDALIWSNSVQVIVPVWCDITTKLLVGANFALPAACLCLCIHLEQVASVRSAKTTFMDKRRRQIIESLMCFGLPLLFMGLHYIVQGHRFDIIEGYGCRPTTYFSIPAIFIVYLPPLLMGVAALVFAALALRHFIVRRITFAAHISANSALTTSRYLRLVFMSILQMFWTITATSYTLWFTATYLPIRPWTTWSDVHSDFWRVDQYPAIMIPDIVDRSYHALWWIIPASTFLFVGFFSFGQDAIEEYKKCFEWLRVHIFRGQQTNVTKKGATILPSRRSPKAAFLTSSSMSTLASHRNSQATSHKSSPSVSYSQATEADLELAQKPLEVRSQSLYVVGVALGSFSDLTPPPSACSTSLSDRQESLASE